MGKFSPSEIPCEWRDLLLLIPGYDAIATAPPGSWFDEDEVSLRLDFFPECLQHIEGHLAGKPFELQPWQKSFVSNLFGWKIRDSLGREVRRYRETLLFVARKNGKTPIVGGLAVQELTISQEQGQQNYIAAGDREQAGMLFRHCKGMVEREPMLASQFNIYGGGGSAGQSKSIVRTSDLSFLRVVSADADTKHGGNTHLAIIDELHVQPNRDLVDVLKTSMASQNRKQPLLIFVTTSDYDRPSICNEMHEYASKVRDGIIVDPAFLPVIYEVPQSANWKDESEWPKANPNLGVSVSLDYLRAECKRAQEIPAYENTFRRLHLNQKTTTAEKCIPLEQWDACAGDIDEASLDGRDVCVALDIGAMSDFTALARLFPHDDTEQITIPPDESSPDAEPIILIRRSYTLLMTFWLPEDPIRRDPRMARVIDGWRKEGFIRTTPGNVVDYDLVLNDIVELLSPYQLSGLLFDRGFQGSQMGTNLQKHYAEKVESFNQGILGMNAPFREFLQLLSVSRIHHDGNPVMRWMVSNVVAEERGGLIKPSKDKSADKIDGVTAAVMALALGSRSNDLNWFTSSGGLFGRGIDSTMGAKA